MITKETLEDSLRRFKDNKDLLDVSGTDLEKCLFLIDELASVSFECCTKESLECLMNLIYKLAHGYNKYNNCYEVHVDWRKGMLVLYENYKKDSNYLLKLTIEGVSI